MTIDVLKEKSSECNTKYVNDKAIKVDTIRKILIIRRRKRFGNII